jgi:hypothetical protein
MDSCVSFPPALEQGLRDLAIVVCFRRLHEDQQNRNRVLHPGVRLCRRCLGRFGANGFTPNGFTPNGFTPNGFTPNGFTPNGFTPNGFTPNGFTPNGFTPNGFTPNGFTPNGFTPNGIGWNSASPAWSQGARSNSTHAFMQLPQLAKASLAE